jgi:hypothetical protein
MCYFLTLSSPWLVPCMQFPTPSQDSTHELDIFLTKTCTQKFSTSITAKVARRGLHLLICTLSLFFILSEDHKLEPRWSLLRHL